MTSLKDYEGKLPESRLEEKEEKKDKTELIQRSDKNEAAINKRIKSARKENPDKEPI